MNLFSKLSKTAKIMILSVVAVCFVLFPVGLLVINLFKPSGVFETLPETLPYALGLALGAFCSVVKIVLIENSLNRIVDLGEEEKDKAKLMGTAFYMGRSFFTIAVLAAGIIIPVVSIAGTVVGVLSLRIAAPLGHVIEMKLEKKAE